MSDFQEKDQHKNPILVGDGDFLIRRRKKKSIAPRSFPCDKVGIDLDLNRMQGTLAPKRKEATSFTSNEVRVRIMTCSASSTALICHNNENLFFTFFNFLRLILFLSIFQTMSEEEELLG